MFNFLWASMSLLIASSIVDRGQARFTLMKPSPSLPKINLFPILTFLAGLAAQGKIVESQKLFSNRYIRSREVKYYAKCNL